MSIKRTRIKPQHIVRSRSRSATEGWLGYGLLNWRCALGRSGICANKKEADGTTPKGAFQFRKVFYRSDKMRRPSTLLPVVPIERNMGWCDAPGDRNYNRAVRHPYPASAERLWRGDDVYDLVLVLSHNERPRVRGRGSAVFIHVARPGYKPTEGCVALKKSDLLKLLSRANRHSKIFIR